MTRTPRLYIWTVLIALLGFAVPASAQYRPRPINDPATGEQFHIEGGADFWFPTPRSSSPAAAPVRCRG